MEALMEGPALAPPEGVIPNLDHPQNKNGLALFVFVFCSVISTICVLLRGYGRLWLLKRFQAEDGLIISAFGLFWGCVWSMFGMMQTPGYFVHQYEVRMKDLIPMTYYMFIMGNIYVVVLMLLKVAMLVEWSRILVPQNARRSSFFWWGCMAMIALQTSACVGIVIALNFQCIPHKASWDFTITDKTCYPLYNIQLGSGIIYLATDIIMFFMPHHLIWSLQLSWGKKLGVSIVFGLGLLACLAAAFRLRVTINYGHASDATYNVGELVFWVMAEMTCGFFVTCVPVIPKIVQDTGILRKIKKGLGLTRTGNTPNRGGGYGDTTRKGGSVLASVNRGGAMPTAAGNAYYKLDEDGMPLADLKGSESTEYLRYEEEKARSAAPPGRGQIVRTTQIMVDESVDDGYGRRDAHNKQQWGS